MDSYASTSDVLRKWSVVPWTYNSTAGRGGGGALTATGAQVNLYTPTGLTTSAEFCVAFWVKVSTTPSALCAFMTPLNTGGGGTNCIAVNTSGQLAVYATALGVNLRAGPTLHSICDNAWHWVEIDMNTTGAAVNKIYIDGVLELSAAAGSAGATAADRIAFTNPTTTTCTLDDVIIWDNTAGNGPVFSSIPLGPRQISTGRPNGDGTVQFTPSSGSSNYLMVNESSPDGDTSYVQSATSGQQDLYDFANLSVAPTSITSVILNSHVENPNPGTINFKGICKSSATQTDGTSIIAPSNYRTLQQAFGIDPNTAAAWTTAGLNAAQFGIKVV